MARVQEDARRFGMDARSLANLDRALSNSSAAASSSWDPIAIDDRTPPTMVEYDGVWPETLPIVEAFLAVSLQWRVAAHGGGGVAGMGGGMFAPIVPLFIGLDYTAVRAGLDAEGIAVTPELWCGIRIMEAEACAVLNESN